MAGLNQEFFKRYSHEMPQHPNTPSAEKLLHSNREFFIEQMKDIRSDPKWTRDNVDHPIGKFKLGEHYDYLREHDPERLYMAMLPFMKLLGKKESFFVRKNLRMKEIFPDERAHVIPDNKNEENGITSFKVVNNDPSLVDYTKPFIHYVVDKDDKYMASKRYGGGAWPPAKEIKKVPGMLSKKLDGRLWAHAYIPSRRTLNFAGHCRRYKANRVPGHTVRFGCNNRVKGKITPKVDGTFCHIETTDKGLTTSGRDGLGYIWPEPSVNVEVEVEQLEGSNKLFLTTVRRMPFPNHWGASGLKYFLEKYDVRFTLKGKEYVIDRTPEFDDNWIANCPYDGIVIKDGDLEFAFKFQKQADLDADSYQKAIDEGWIVDRPPIGVCEYNLHHDVETGKVKLLYNKPRPDKPWGNHWNNIRRMPYDPDAYQILETMEANGDITHEAAQQIIKGYHDSQAGKFNAAEMKWSGA